MNNNLNIKIFTQNEFQSQDHWKMMGDGQFSLFEVKELSTNQKYALKIINYRDNEKNEPILIKNISLYSHLQHPTILLPTGITLEYPNYVITQIQPNISVQYLIDAAYERNSDLYGFTLTNKFIILLGVALGMRYLHLNHISHFNLKPSNVLLDENFYPKISDYGLNYGRIRFFNFHEARYMTAIYSAPELFEASTFGPKADVYSYGMMIYSILFERNPFDEYKDQDHYDIFPISRRISYGKRPSLDPDLDNELQILDNPMVRRLIERCWDQDPSRRPDFDIIIDPLIEIIEETEGINKGEINSFLHYCGEDFRPRQ